jgi:DNA polymerase-3 subunit delta'
MTVWDDLVGQEHAVAELDRAVRAARSEGQDRTGGPMGAESRMTSAWLFTGPPGSGRSNAARAFAAALECSADEPGCGVCAGCRAVLHRASPDVQSVTTSLLSHGVADMRDLVQKAARLPVAGRWQILLLEDADRLTDQAGNALLKAIEEPGPRTLWLLCAPTVDDVLPTVRSRCRVVTLRIPPVRAVAEVLVRRDGIDPGMAAFAARAAGGHVGRARRLALDEQARLRRSAVLRVPLALDSLASCLAAAAELVESAAAEAKENGAELDKRETEDLSRSLGAGSTGRGMVAGAAGQLKELDRTQKTRGKRLQRDALDRTLTDLASFYRDVLMLQLGADVVLTTDEHRPALDTVARGSSPEATRRRLEAVLACRTALEGNVAPLLAVEAAMVALRAG